jgi:hypothetical protein
MREQAEYYDFLRLIARQDPWSEHVSLHSTRRCNRSCRLSSIPL